MLAIVQARLGSTRLPNKSLLPLAGKPLIAHVMDRAAQIGLGHFRTIVLATPWRDRQALACGWWTVKAYRTVDDDDVLARFVRVAEELPECDPIIRVTGDCPLFSPKIADQVVALYHDTRGCEYAWNVAPGYVDGTDVEVFSRDALIWAGREATDAFDREHVTPWLRRHVKVATLLPEHPTDLKTSVDTPEDYERVRAMVEVHAHTL